MPGREATLVVASAADRPGREVKLTAEPRPTNRLLDLVIVLDTVAGILVVLGAGWLVWTRPGLMTWGFFVYVPVQSRPGVSVLGLAPALAAAWRRTSFFL
jgi:hypothetical protein